MVGDWDLADNVARYLGPGVPEGGFGVALGPHDLQTGWLSTTISFPASDETEPQGRIVFGYDPATLGFYSAGLGGYHRLYVLEEFVANRGFVPIRSDGLSDNLRRDEPYEVSVMVIGQTAVLVVDQVEIAEVELPHPLLGHGVGVTAWGEGQVESRTYMWGPNNQKPSW